MRWMSDIFSFEEYLDQYGTLTYTNVGISMMPLLRQGKDMFTVRKKGVERCRKGDVVLYRRPPDKYVLHRIVEVRPDDYVILGDNCVVKEYGIRDEDIIGVLTGYVRDGREHSVDEPAYRAYSNVWLNTIMLRTGLKRSWWKTKQLIKKMIRKD